MWVVRAFMPFNADLYDMD